MDANVTKYEVMISDALRAKMDVERKEKSLKKAKELLSKRSAGLIEDSKKCFDEAVLRYNQNKQGLYEIFNANISIDLECNTLSANLKLRFSVDSGEPDEFFDSKDHLSILSALKPLVDEELKKQGIPLTFDSFWVPNHYYPK